MPHIVNTGPTAPIATPNAKDSKRDDEKHRAQKQKGKGKR